MNSRITSGVLCLITAFLRAFLNAAATPRRSNIRTNRQRFATSLGFLCLLASLPLSAQYNISTLAGNGNAGFGGDNGPATEALLNKPRGIAVDKDGNVYIADQLTNRVRKVDRKGNITTVAGGTASAAAQSVQLNSPAGVAVDASGDLYIVDQASNTVRMIDSTGAISTFAGGGSENVRARGVATEALLNNPTGIAVDSTGRVLVSEAGNHAVTAVNESGRISTISDQVNDARAVAVDGLGNIYVADAAKSRILKIDMTGVVTTVAGTGVAGFEGDGGAATDARLSNPQGVAVDAAGNLYIADTGNNRIRKVNVTGVISTVAGTGTSGFSGDGGVAAKAQLSSPSGIAVDTAGNLYVSDAGNQRVRVLALIVESDFDRNGVPDLVWQDDITSQVTVHYYGGAGGAVLQSWSWLNQAGEPGWHVVAVADFNQDGVPDLVWQNDSTRQVVVHYYGGPGGATLMGWNWLNQAGVTGWHVAGAADFNGDGHPDLVWQNDATRAVTVHYYSGTGGATYLSWAWLNQTGVAGWSVVAIADFNGDGFPDLVWQNDATSSTTVNYFGGTGGATLQGWNWLNQAGVAGWHVKLAADFNGDGHPDLVWQNDSTRQVVVHYYGGTGGATYLSWNWLNQSNVPGWTIFSELLSSLSNNIVLPTSVTVGYGQSVPFAVTLSSPAPTGGVTITLSSSNTSNLTISPTSVFIAAGSTTPATQPQVTGAGMGSATISASATGYTAVSLAVQVSGSMSFSPTSLTVSGAGTQNLTLNLNGIAMTQVVGTGFKVNLSSSNMSVATVPATITFAANTTSVTVPVTTIAPGNTTITASGLTNFLNTTATVTVTNPGTLSFTPQTLTITGTTTQNLTLNVSTPAPAGGLTVNLSSSNTAAATVPATATFAANATTTTVAVTGVAAGSTVIHASALPNLADTTANVTVQPSGTIGTSSNIVVGLGQSVAFPVTLPSPAPTGGVTVTLSSADTTKVTVSPSTVTIAQGATTPATQPQVTGVNIGTVNVTAAAPGYTTGSQSVQVSATVLFSPATLSITGATTQNLNLTLSAPAPAGGVTVNISSSNTSVATVPASVTFAANATSVNVPVTGVAVASGTAVIHASAPPNIADTTANVSVSPAGAIVLPANTTVGLGQSTAFTVTLPAAAPAGGITVTLSSSDASKVTVPPSVLIPAGATTPTTQPQVNGVGLGSANITASAGGYTSATQPVLVTATVSFSPASATIIGTGTQNLTLNLSAQAPVGGVVINLSSSNTSIATVPATVTFAAGANAVTVPVTGVAVGTSTITASSLPAIANATASITVQPAGGITVPSNVSVGVGQVTPFAITLPTPAPAGGVSVTLSSSNTNTVTVFPSSVSVAAGATQPATQPQVAGVSLGSATVTASASLYSSGSQTVQVTASVAFSPTNVSITGPTVQNVTLTLSTPAPAGGQVVNLSSSNTGVATTPATVTFPANATTVNVPVTGVSIGTATIHASALPNIADTTANVTVGSAGAITIPSNSTVGLGQSATFPVTIANPAGTGGVTIMLSSSDTSKVTITPASIFIAAGATAPTTQPTVNGVNFGIVTINAAAAGYTAASQQVQTTASIVFSPATLNITGPQVQNLTLTLSAAAPAAGLTINLSSTNPTTATVPATVTFAAGTTSVSVPVTGISIGSTVVHGSASPNVPDTTATVNVVSAGTIGLPANTSVAIGQSALYAVTLPVPAPAGGVTVTLTSSDTTKVTVSTGSVFIAAGATTPATQPQVTAVSIGSASITASASGFTSGTQTVQTTATVSFSPGTMTITGLTTQNITLNLSAPAPAGGLTVSLSSSNSGVASVASTATFTQGATSITIPVTALALGSTVLHASALPNVADTTATVNIVTGGAIGLPSNVSLGLGQSTPFGISLPTPAPATGVTVTLTSSNSSAVSVTSSVAIAGGATTPATQPQVVGANVGSATITASAPGYTTSSQTVQVTASIGFSPNSLTIVGPTTQNLTLTLSGPAPTSGLTISLSSTNTAAAIVPGTVTFAAGTTSVSVPVTGVAVGNTVINASALPAIANVTANVSVVSAGGISLQSNVTVGLAHSASLTVTLPSAAPAGGITVGLTSSDPTKATISSSVFITAGATTPATQPQVTGVNLGSVTITASASGYTTGSQTVQVNATASFTPTSLTITGPSTQNLTLNLSGAAPSGGLTLNLTSDNTGAATVPSTVNFPANSTSVTVPVTGVAVGTANIHANLLPYIADTTAGVSVVSEGPISVPSNVSVGLAHSTSFPISLPGAAPAGGVTVTLTSSNTSAVTVAPMAVFIGAGATTPTAQPTVNGINLGSANITASAPGFTSSTQAVTVGASLTLAPSTATLTGPGTQTMTLTLSGAAPAGGLTVNLSSTNSSVATVPATVTFPSGATSVSFTVNGISIGSTVINASALPYIANTTASLSVASGGLISLPAGLVVGLTQSVSYSVVLPEPAPLGGTTVLLNSSDPTILTISPTSVVIPAGSQVPVTQPLVNAVNFGTVTVSAAATGFTSASQAVQVNATASFAPTSLTITGATTQTLTLTLSAPAPSAGLVMNLSSSNTSVATVPSTVTFASGATTANVQVTGVAVGTTVISASSLPNVAVVAANVTVQSQIILPSNVTLGLGKTANFQVSLVSPAGPSGAYVSLSSSNPSVVSVSPANFFISQGNTLPAATPQVTANANGSATITATIYGDLPATQSVQVINATITFSPNTATIVGTGTTSLALTLSTQAPAGGLTVNLSSNNTSVATVPATATFPANTTSTSVPITGVNPGTAVITASALPNIAAVTATATVVAPGSIVLPAFYTVGQFQTTPFAVSLGTAAPTGGLTVTLSSSDPTKLTITPATLTFAAGSTTPTVTPQVYGADLGYSTVTATAPGYTSASLSVHISDGIRINLQSGVTVGLGQSAPYTVILDQVAPAGGTTITLSSTNSSVGVSATAFVPAGATQPTTLPTVTGLNVGSAQINASAPGFTSASPQTVNVNATMAFTPNTLSVSAPNTQNATLTLSGAAPSGGLTINLASSNTSVATVPTSVTFAAGATTVSVPVTGAAVGSATITASTTAPNLPSTTLSVTVTAAAGMIGLPSGVSVGLGNSVAFPITLPIVAPTGGVTVNLTSANTSLATVTSSVFVAAGATQPATQPQVTGVGLGAVNISASATGYTSAVQQVQVGATMTFSPNTVSIAGTGTQNLTLVLSAAAPSGGLTVNLSSNNTSVATVPSSVTITAGLSSVTVPVTGVTPGTATITASASPNVPSTTATATVTTAVILGAINVSNISVGQGLENALTITLTTAPTADLIVTLTSSKPNNALVAGRVADPGATSATVTVPAGLTTVGGAYVQGLVSSGTATITATAANYTSGNATVTLAPAGFIMAGPNGIGSSTFTTSQGLNSTITVQPARLDSSFNFVEVENVAGGTSATINVTSSNTTVGTISTSPITITGGTNSQTTTFNAVNAGSTTISVSASGYGTPAQDTSVTATVQASGIVAANATVGLNLETAVTGSFNGASPANNTAVTVVSNSPSTLLLSTNGTDQGFASISLNIPSAGLTHLPTFYVYGLASSGTATYTVSLPNYPSFGTGTGTVTLQPSGVILSPPDGTGQPTFPTNIQAAASTITLYTALLDPSNNFVQPMALAGYQSATVNVISSNTSVGTITTSPVTIAAGTNSITTQFQPTGVGSSVISVSTPTGFNTPNQDTSVTATVSQPGMAISTNVTVGMNLEAGGQVSIGAAAGTDTVVTLMSNNSNLLLAVNATDAGSNSIQVTIPAGSTAATYYLIGLASSGTATYSASATGYGNHNGTVTMAPSGVTIVGPYGPFITASIAAGATPFTLYVGQLDPTSHNFVIQQQIARNQSITVTLNDSNPAIGTVPATVTIPAGQSTAVVQFTPLATGSTVISVATPTGYTTSSNETSLTAAVSQ